MENFWKKKTLKPYNAKNTVILSNFLVCTFCGKAQFQHQEIRWNYGLFRSVIPYAFFVQFFLVSRFPHGIKLKVTLKKPFGKSDNRWSHYSHGTDACFTDWKPCFAYVFKNWKWHCHSTSLVEETFMKISQHNITNTCLIEKANWTNTTFLIGKIWSAFEMSHWELFRNFRN